MSTSTSTQLFQDIVLGGFRTRRFLFHTLHQSQASVPPPLPNTHDRSEPSGGDRSFGANVIMFLAVLLCALICSLGLNSMLRCALRYSNFVSSESSADQAARLANTGVRRKALKAFQTIKFSAESKPGGMNMECAICLSEFGHGDHVRLLPKCNHGFHVQCIDKWLGSHSSCPNCRHCLVKSCRKIVGRGQASSSEPPQQVGVHMAPLGPEGLICGYL